jgi:uncharacterized protein
MKNSAKLLTRIATLGTAIYIVTVGIGGAQQLDMVSGSVGGGYFKAAAALSGYVAEEYPDIKITVRPGAGWANIDQLDSGAADLAVIENVLSSLAFKGESPTGDKYDFRMLAAVRGPSVVQAFVPVDRGVESFEQIAREKMPLRIATFESAHIVTPIAMDVLAEYGITKEKLESWGGKLINTSLDEGFRMIGDGVADVWISGGSYYPHPAAIELGVKGEYRVLSLSDEVAEAVAKKYGLGIAEVPGDAYAKYNGLGETYKSPSLIVTFAVRTTLDDDVAYNIMDALWKHKDDFHALHAQHTVFELGFAQENVGLTPIHPGAQRWYDEHK